MASPGTMSAWSYKHWVTHAELLVDMRARCWNDSQLMMLDRLIGEFILIYTEDAPRSFDADWFADKAGRYTQRMKNTLILEGDRTP